MVGQDNVDHGHRFVPDQSDAMPTAGGVLGEENRSRQQPAGLPIARLDLALARQVDRNHASRGRGKVSLPPGRNNPHAVTKGLLERSNQDRRRERAFQFMQRKIDVLEV